MTAAPSPPSRCRRSIIVAIAVLVIGLGWWFWPRGDARFVGQWQMFMNDETEPYGTIRFYRNGSSLFTSADQAAESGRWRVDGKNLVMSCRVPLVFLLPGRGLRQRLWLRVVLLIESWTGFELAEIWDSNPLEITAVAPNELRFKTDSYNHTIAFRRIPE